MKKERKKERKRCITSFLICVLLLAGCAHVADNTDLTAAQKVNCSVKSKASVLLLPSQSVIEKEEANKTKLFPDCFDSSWVVKEAGELFSELGFGDVSIDKIEEKYVKAVISNIMLKTALRTKDFEKLKNRKYQNQSCEIDYQKIKKGDIILTVTHNPMLMAIDGENSVHHALLCIDDPTSDNSKVLLTTNGFSDGKVDLYSLSFIGENDDTAVVMRSYYPENLDIDKMIGFALNQIGKEYNINFIDKKTEDKYYCTQLVYKCYLEAGINVDSNDKEVTDYNIVLASDILKSKYLYIAEIFN